MGLRSYRCYTFRMKLKPPADLLYHHRLLWHMLFTSWIYLVACRRYFSSIVRRDKENGETMRVRRNETQRWSTSIFVQILDFPLKQWFHTLVIIQYIFYLLLCMEIFPVKSIFNQKHIGKNVAGHLDFAESVLSEFFFDLCQLYSILWHWVGLDWKIQFE